MHSNNSKKVSDKVAKIFDELKKVNNFSKALIKYGILAVLILMSTTLVILILNKTVLWYSGYTEFIATTLIKNSVIVLAEFVIGGLAIDYFIKSRG